MNRRSCLVAGASLAATAALGRDLTAGYDAAVRISIAGTPTFPDLASAIRAAPLRPAGKPWRVILGRGVLSGRVIVDKPDIHLVGQGAETVISSAQAAGDLDAGGQALGTWGCATLTVRARGFEAKDLTIENAFDYLAALQAATYQRIGPNGAQAVALMLDQGADRARFQRVIITGHQDTLFTDQGLSSFEQCKITGSVDFIFGGGTAVFDRCEILSRYRPGLQRNHGFVTAPSTPAASPFGLVFLDCRLTAEAQTPPASVVLGRPWRPSRSFADGRYGDPQAVGAAAFIRCYMGDHISADGWDEMGYQSKSGAKVYLSPAQARFAEFGSTGPGAFENRRRPWLSPDSARAFNRQHVLGGWDPSV